MTALAWYGSAVEASASAYSCSYSCRRCKQSTTSGRIKKASALISVIRKRSYDLIQGQSLIRAVAKAEIEFDLGQGQPGFFFLVKLAVNGVNKAKATRKIERLQKLAYPRAIFLHQDALCLRMWKYYAGTTRTFSHFVTVWFLSRRVTAFHFQVYSFFLNRPAKDPARPSKWRAIIEKALYDFVPKIWR